MPKKRGSSSLPPEADPDIEEPARGVQLPPAPSPALVRARAAEADRRRALRRPTPVSSDDGRKGVGDRLSSLSSQPTRPSMLHRLSRYSGELVGRSSMVQIAEAAELLAVATHRRVPRHVAWGGTVAVVAGALLLLLLSAAFALERYSWLPNGFLFLAVMAALAGASTRALPALARRLGERAIPGRTSIWLALGFGALAAGAWAITWPVSHMTVRAGHALTPTVRRYMPDLAPAPPATEPPPPKALDVASRLRRQTWVSPGLLYVPPSFAPTEDGFDLLLHFHGSPELVRQSVEASGLNALMHVTNLGASSRDYQSAFTPQGALDSLVTRVRDKAGLTELSVRRLALSSWSAGFGAPLVILSDAEIAKRVDALLVLDGIHVGFAPGGARRVEPSAIASFVAFAREAAAGRKLMWLTHSAIETYDYSSSTEAADAILASLGVPRGPVDESASPPEVHLSAALRAFPADSRRWLRARTAAHAGGLDVAGYAGQSPEDHIAHLAQMSVTVLPALVKRWAAPTAGPAR